MDHLYKLTGRGAYRHAALGVDVQKDDPFLFIEDEDTREYLLSVEWFDHVTGEELEDALSGEEGEVIAAIQDGEWDDILDFALYAERETENRPRVCDVIVQRSQTLELKRRDDDTAISANDLTVER